MMRRSGASPIGSCFFESAAGQCDEQGDPYGGCAGGHRDPAGQVCDQQARAQRCGSDSYAGAGEDRADDASLYMLGRRGCEFC